MGERCHERVLDHEQICERRCRRKAEPGTLYCWQHTLRTRAEVVTEAHALGREEGAAAERARIVAWLRVRLPEEHWMRPNDDSLANEIEAGAHMPEQGGEEEPQTEHFRCPDCGPRIKADEDGCCTMCGADCTIESMPEQGGEE